ncbi:MAG: ASCH domain-containing protein [Chlorobia bacterium]|nr:ASCH domain-containing protein [Fimbriimonadaceae bacterium]
MVFARSLRDRVRSGKITSSVRIWLRPRVKVGGRYPLFPGWILVESIEEIGMGDITEILAIESGFDSVADLLSTAKHGQGERVFLVKFRFTSSGSQETAT